MIFPNFYPILTSFKKTSQIKYTFSKYSVLETSELIIPSLLPHLTPTHFQLTFRTCRRNGALDIRLFRMLHVVLVEDFLLTLIIVLLQRLNIRVGGPAACGCLVDEGLDEGGISLYYRLLYLFAAQKANGYADDKKGQDSGDEGVQQEHPVLFALQLVILNSVQQRASPFRRLLLLFLFLSQHGCSDKVLPPFVLRHHARLRFIPDSVGPALQLLGHLLDTQLLQFLLVVLVLLGELE